MSRVARALALAAAALTLAACGSAVGAQTSQQASGPANATSSSTSTTAAPTTTTSTTIAKPARALHKVLLLGDSEMYDAAPFATEAFKAAGLDVYSEAFPGTSLLGKTQVTQTFASVLDAHDPDAVILLYTGVYFPPYPKTPDGGDILLATPEFWKAWTDAAVQATKTLTARGARVYWVLLPHNDVTWREHDTRMIDAYLAVRSAIPTVGYIDWRRTIVSGPHGEPLTIAPIGPSGAVEAVRGPDGHHFSADASHVLADVMVQTVLRDYGVSGAS